MALAPITDRLPDQYYADENFKEIVQEGVKELLVNVVSKQEYFQVKFEVAQFTLQSQICVLIKINQEKKSYVRQRLLWQIASFDN